MGDRLNILAISYETMRKHANWLDQKELIALHWGKKIADNK